MLFLELLLLLLLLNTLPVGNPEEKEGKRSCYSLKMHGVGTVAGTSAGRPLPKLHVKWAKKVHIYLIHSQQRVQKWSVCFHYSIVFYLWRSKLLQK